MYSQMLHKTSCDFKSYMHYLIIIYICVKRAMCVVTLVIPKNAVACGQHLFLLIFLFFEDRLQKLTSNLP